jgi:small conductance mechanosensitive channel
MLPRAILIAIGLVLGSTSAGAGQTQPATAAPAAAGISAGQAHDLVTLLSDPARRNQLIGQLQALEKIAPATAAAPATAPAPAASPATSATPATVVTRTVPASGLLSQLVRAAPRWASGVFGQFASLRHVLGGIPASWAWLTQTATDDAARQYLLHVGFGLMVVLAPAALVWIGLRWLVRGRRVRLGALAARDNPPDDGAPDDHLNDGKKKLSQRMLGSARLLSLALLAFVLDIVPVAGFSAVAYLLTPALTEPGPAQLVVLGIADAFAVFAGVLCLARVLFAPDIQPLRLSRIRWLDQRIPFAIRSWDRFAEVRREWQVPGHGQ